MNGILNLLGSIWRSSEDELRYLNKTLTMMGGAIFGLMLVQYLSLLAGNYPAVVFIIAFACWAVIGYRSFSLGRLLRIGLFGTAAGEIGELFGIVQPAGGLNVDRTFRVYIQSAVTLFLLFTAFCMVIPSVPLNYAPMLFFILPMVIFALVATLGIFFFTLGRAVSVIVIMVIFVLNVLFMIPSFRLYTGMDKWFASYATNEQASILNDYAERERLARERQISQDLRAVLAWKDSNPGKKESEINVRFLAGIKDANKKTLAELQQEIDKEKEEKERQAHLVREKQQRDDDQRKVQEAQRKQQEEQERERQQRAAIEAAKATGKIYLPIDSPKVVLKAQQGLEKGLYYDVYLDRDSPFQEITTEVWRYGNKVHTAKLWPGKGNLSQIIEGDEIRITPQPSTQKPLTFVLFKTKPY